MSTEKSRTSSFLDEKYERLAEGFVSYKDLCTVTKVNSDTDKEPFSTIPSIGNGVIGQYTSYFREMALALPNTIVRKSVYEKLQAVDKSLKQKNPNWQLVVVCGYRLLEFQERAFEKQKAKLEEFYTDETDLLEAVHRVIAVPHVSGHPTGGAVDVVVYDFVKNEYLDFGTEVGDFDTKDVYYAATGIRVSPISKKKKPAVEANRIMLRSLMTAQGFSPYDGEWWHFSYGDREWAFYTNKRESNKGNQGAVVAKEALYRQKSLDEVFYTEKYKIQDKSENPRLIRLAIQKNGRLTEDTIEILNKSGIDVTLDKSRFFGKCRNFPLELLFVRDDDIPNFVDAGIADLGIVGKNTCFENDCVSKELLELDFGHCSLALAVPDSSNIKTVEDLVGKKIATSYKNSTIDFLKRKGIDIDEVEIIYIAGSVEIAPSLKYADAIIDLVSTGGSLKQNKLHAIETIMNSQSVLIVNQESMENKLKRQSLDDFMVRLTSFLTAKKYKQVVMRIPKEYADKINEAKDRKEILSIDISRAEDFEGCYSTRTVVEKNFLWDIVDDFKKAFKAKDIMFYDIEGIVN